MDNPGDGSVYEWSTPVLAGAAMAVGGLILLGGSVALSSDPVGLVLMAFAGLLLLGFGVVLVAAAATAASGDAARRTHATHGRGLPDLHTGRCRARVRIRQLRRIGRRSSQLELEICAIRR